MKKITLLIISFLSLTIATQAQTNNYLNISTTGSRLKITNSSAINVTASQSKTITFRIKIPSGNNTNFSKIMLKNDSSSAGNGQYGITFGSSTTLPHTDIRLLSSSTTPAAYGNSNNNSLASTINDGNWHHFALVLNDIDGKTRLYYDGFVLISSTAPGAIDMTNTSDLYFGASSTGGTPVLMSIDDIHIWDTALTPYQIINDINTSINATTAPTTTGLLAAYDFESATLSAIPDITAKTTSATVMQAASSTDAILTNPSNINFTTSTFWNGSSWSNGAPTSSLDAFISGNYNEATNITAKSLTVDNNAIVTIPSNTKISLTGILYVGNGSNFTLENNANLIQTTTSYNVGNITVKRNSAPMVLYDYTLWSSPVTSQKLYTFSPLTATTPTIRFYSYNTGTDSYDNTGLSSSSNFARCKGYAIRAPYNYTSSPQTFNGQFTGVPNNGTFTIASDFSGSGYNLIGNPYPSPIDATTFVTTNTAVIEGTLYFLSHNIKSDGTSYESTSMQYATWNSTGSVGAPAALGSSTITGMNNTSTPNGIIQVGQGFIVKAKNTAAANITFNNGMRTVTGTAANADQFFKMATTKSANSTIATEKHRLWLDLTNANGEGLSQLLVGYVDGATNEADNLYDGEEFGNPKTSLTSLLNGKNYTIQGRALPFADTDTVPLAFKAATKGTYTIALNKTDGVFATDQEVLLKDNATGTLTNLKTGGYTFTATAGTTNSRFELAYAKSAINTMGLEAPITAVKKQGVFHINTNGAILKDVAVYDLQGHEILKQQNINSTTSSLTGLPSTRGVLIIKVTTDTNQTQTIKIIN
ncbi:LamG-like jellyroll fold domain-containing protein [Flavobacterium sp.]|uniref:LamG-like jellyroll fold domain-containing protein n=1 Tax=Flavobacterium sp. TaxID=239 RepID=UPI0025FAC02E|nr:LamG-like jellyroll fold domain-containing protein [Flavobacterium sp.]